MMVGALLIVDDNPDVRDLLVHELAGEYVVVAAEDARSARRVLAQRDDIVAVVSDLRMETATAGAELLEEVQRGRPWCARVLISGSLPPELAVRVRLTGAAHALVPKPWRDGELRAAVRRALSACTGREGGGGAPLSRC
jgi:two-component system, NtrC family, response regulator